MYLERRHHQRKVEPTTLALTAAPPVCARAHGIVVDRYLEIRFEESLINKINIEYIYIYSNIT